MYLEIKFHKKKFKKIHIIRNAKERKFFILKHIIQVVYIINQKN